ncbi:hypothetical protein HDE_04249 [Halotydeus destructor]|nr:hypothetical protein HDE_04249 [Halotydeus destructor]
MSSFSQLSEIYERYRKYSKLRCCAAQSFKTLGNNNLQCCVCSAATGFQHFILTLPPPASCEAGREYFRLNAEPDVLVRVPVIYLEDKPLIANLKLSTFENIFRIYAMMASSFLNNSLVKPEMKEIMLDRRSENYSRAIAHFDEILNSSMNEVGGMKLTKSLFSMYRQLFLEFKASMKTTKIDPVDLLESRLLPIYCSLVGSAGTEKYDIPDGMELTTDWFYFYQETLCRARETVSRYVATIDLVLSLLPLVVILQHQEPQPQASVETEYGRLIISQPSMAHLADLECALTPDRIQKLVFSFIGFQLYRFSSGFYDRQFGETKIFQTTLSCARRYCSIRNNKTHDSKYRWLVRNLRNVDSDPDDRLVIDIGKLYNSLRPEIAAICRGHGVVSSDVESVLISQLYPYTLFTPPGNVCEDMKTFYGYLPIHMCHQKIQSQQYSGSQMLKKLCRIRKRILSLFKITSDLLHGDENHLVNPLTSDILLENQQLVENLNALLDEWSQVFKDE